MLKKYIKKIVDEAIENQWMCIMSKHTPYYCKTHVAINQIEKLREKLKTNKKILDGIKPIKD